jgi:allantoinase
MTALAPAQRFGLADRKGAIRPGLDADLAHHDAAADWTVEGSAFHRLGKWSAFDGFVCHGKVARTMIRGVTVYEEGENRVAPGFGHFLTRRRVNAGYPRREDG